MEFRTVSDVMANWLSFSDIASSDDRKQPGSTSEAPAPIPEATHGANFNPTEPENINNSEGQITPADSTFSAPGGTSFTPFTPALTPTYSVYADNVDKDFRSAGEEEGRGYFPIPDSEQHDLQTRRNRLLQPQESFPSKWSRLLSPTRRQTEPGQPQTAELEAKGFGAVKVPIPSQDMIFPFRGVPGLYVGLDDRIRPPAELVERWERDIEPRFWTDAREFLNKMMKTKKGHRYPPGMSLELRMSGYASPPTEVELLPRIWVLYDHDRWAKGIKMFVRESEWLQHEGFGPVEVRKGSPRLATLDPPTFIKGLGVDPGHGFPIGQDFYLYLHVERRQDTSAVGLLCCATVTKDGSIRGQRLSRLGGLVSFNNGTTSLAITTAHGMLELAWDILFDDASDPDDLSELGESSPDTGYESDGNSDIDGATWAPALPTPRSTFNRDEIREWDTVEIIGVTSFLGNSTLDLSSAASARQSWVPEPSPASRPCEDTDFSLWRIPRGPMLENTYQHHPSGTPVPIRNIFSGFSELFHHLDTEPVTVLLGPELLINAQLVPSTSHFMVHGTKFTTHKIRMDAPLGPGCSGSWVVKDERLVGMVIASYEFEPFAHIIACGDLLSAVKYAVPQAKTLQFDGKVSPLIWSEWSRYAKEATHSGQSYGGSNPGNFMVAVPASHDKMAHQDLVDMMLKEKKSKNRSTIPLHTTPGTFAELEVKLITVGNAVDKVIRVFHHWYTVSKDDVRAKALINLKLHVMDQYQSQSPQQRALKKDLSTTPHELDIGYKLVESIARDLAIAYPRFLKGPTFAEGTTLLDPRAGPTAPLLGETNVSRSNGMLSPAEGHSLLAAESVWTSSPGTTSRKRRRETSPTPEWPMISFPKVKVPRQSQPDQWMNSVDLHVPFGPFHGFPTAMEYLTIGSSLTLDDTPDTTPNVTPEIGPPMRNWTLGISPPMPGISSKPAYFPELGAETFGTANPGFPANGWPDSPAVPNFIGVNPSTTYEPVNNLPFNLTTGVSNVARYANPSELNMYGHTLMRRTPTSHDTLDESLESSDSHIDSSECPTMTSTSDSMDSTASSRRRWFPSTPDIE